MSGRRDSNSRMLAWEANALPLGHTRFMSWIIVFNRITVKKPSS